MEPIECCESKPLSSACEATFTQETVEITDDSLVQKHKTSVSHSPCQEEDFEEDLEWAPMEAKITNAHTVTDDFAAKEAQTPNAENQCQEEDSDEDLEWAPMEADMSKATQGCNMERVQYQRATILMLHEALQILENSDEYWNGIPALVVAEALRSDTCETIEASTARSFFAGDAQSFDSVIGKLTEHFQCLSAFKGKLQDIQGQSSLTFDEVGTIDEDIDDLDW